MRSSRNRSAAAKASSTRSPGMNRRTAFRANGRVGMVRWRRSLRDIQSSADRIGRMARWCHVGVPLVVAVPAEGSSRQPKPEGHPSGLGFKAAANPVDVRGSFS
jgi:hypothetical protein